MLFGWNNLKLRLKNMIQRILYKTLHRKELNLEIVLRPCDECCLVLSIFLSTTIRLQNNHLSCLRVNFGGSGFLSRLFVGRKEFLANLFPCTELRRNLYKIILYNTLLLRILFVNQCHLKCVGILRKLHKLGSNSFSIGCHILTTTLKQIQNRNTRLNQSLLIRRACTFHAVLYLILST